MEGQGSNNDVWKKKILFSLQERNKRQSVMFAELIKSHASLLDFAEGLKSTNQRLTAEVARLKSEDEPIARLSALPTQQFGDNNNNNVQSEKIQMLEQKLYGAQKELMELHKRKGENSQQLIDLNTAIQDHKRMLKERDVSESLKGSTADQIEVKMMNFVCASIRIAMLEKQLMDTSAKCKQLEQTSRETVSANECLLDELIATKTSKLTLEDTARRLQEENRDLVLRCMAWKKREADKMNEENDLFAAKRDEEHKKQMARAGTSTKCPLQDDGFEEITTVVTSVPSRAAHILKDAHQGEVNALRWSPVRCVFVSGGSDRKVKVWDAHGAKCKPQCELIGANASIMSVDLDVDEKVVLASSNDHACRLWTLDTQQLYQTLTGHAEKVLAAKFLNDPQIVVSGSHDRTLKVWDVRRNACVKTFYVGSSCDDLVVVDGQNVISGHFDGKIRFYDLRSGPCSVSEVDLESRITSLGLTSDRRVLLGCTRSNNVAIVDVCTGAVSSTLSADGFHVAFDWTRATFSPDDAYVAAGSSDGGVYVWEVSKRKLHSVLREHSAGVVACAWNPNCQSLLSCDKSKTIVHWTCF